MSRKRFADMHCAVAQSLEQIGDWWTLLIVRDAFNGVESFSDFQRSLGIARNILTQRLGSLVDNGIMTRDAGPTDPRPVYRLTPKGRALWPVLIALMQWGDRWVFDGRGPLRILDRQHGQPIRPLAPIAGDGRPLSFADLRFEAGGGRSEPGESGSHRPRSDPPGSGGL